MPNEQTPAHVLANTALVPITVIQELLAQVVAQQLGPAVYEAVKKAIVEQDEDKYLSADATRNLFEPKISMGTLRNWSAQNILQRHVIAGKVFYRKSEVMAAIKTIHKFKKKS